MSRSRPPVRGEMYTVPPRLFDLGHGDPQGALVLTSAEWNVAMGSTTCAFVYRRPGARRERDVDIGDSWVVDCTHVFPVEHALIDSDDPWNPKVTPEQLDDVASQFWNHLGIQEGLHGPSGWQSPEVIAAWYPKRGAVHGVDFPSMKRHGFAIVSPTESNARNPHAACLMLTSRTGKPGRARWEVAVPGGCLVPGDVYTFPNDEFGPPFGSLPANLSDAQLHSVGLTMVEILQL